MEGGGGSRLSLPVERYANVVQLRRGDRDREKRSRIFPGNELFLRGSVASVLNGEEAISVYETMLHSLNTQEAYMQSCKIVKRLHA